MEAVLRMCALYVRMQDHRKYFSSDWTMAKKILYVPISPVTLTESASNQTVYTLVNWA